MPAEQDLLNQLRKAHMNWERLENHAQSLHSCIPGPLLICTFSLVILSTPECVNDSCAYTYGSVLPGRFLVQS